MNYLVTGGAGFIGRWVVKQLIEENHFVTVIDDMSNGDESNLNEFLTSPNLKLIVCDINKIDKKDDIPKNMDVCIHLISSINVQKSIDDPRHTFEVDIRGTFNVLEYCRLNKIKFVYISTCMVYAPASDTKISENHDTVCVSPYAAAKLAGEKLVEAYNYAYDMPTVILRPFNCYGPYSFHKTLESSVITKFLEWSIKGEKIEIYGDGTQTRDFLYVEDCADFIVRASKNSNAIGEIINAGSGSEISIRDLARKIYNSAEKIQYKEHHHPQSEVRRLICDNNKAKILLDWKPRTKLEEGIQKTKEWVETQMECVKT